MSLFKKKKSKSRDRIRKKENSDTGSLVGGGGGGGGGGDADPSSAAAAEQIEDIRLLQKERRRGGGVSLAVGQDESGTRAAHYTASSNDPGLQNVFTAQEEKQEKDAVQAKMEQFIDEQVRREREKWHQEALIGAGVGSQTTGQDGDEAQQDTGVADEQQQDEELALGNASSLANADEDAAGASGWAAGLEEVSLPIEFKLKNIEETEKAKQAWLRNANRRSRQQQQRADTVPANFNLSTAAKTRFHASSGSANTRKNDAASNGTAAEATESEPKQSSSSVGEKRLMSTDDAAVSRFKKSFVRRNK